MTRPTLSPYTAPAPHREPPRGHTRWRGAVGPVMVVVYVGSVVMANVASTQWTAIRLGSLAVPAGTWWAGITLNARDVLYEAIGRQGVHAAIVVGAGLSWWLATPQMAVASALAFAVSELVDSLVYARVRPRSWMGAMAGSNLIGLVTDSVLFVPLAFGSCTAVPGQLLGKTLATATAVAAAVSARSVWRQVGR